ncbi:MAG: hypothetical protein PF450_14315 [Bacteroidales bacterium]|jgi:hypothetical protein|nr:hypothetical protein [Bacteroidales bacterium]
MNPKQLNEIVDNRLESCKKVLCKKASEYASDTDRLHNFKRAAVILETTPEKALEGMWTKHLVSTQDLINAPETATPKLIHEKIGDMINYLLLLEGLFVERNTNGSLYTTPVMPEGSVSISSEPEQPQERN